MCVSRQGVLIVVSGPSGVGKGTLIREVLQREPSTDRSVSCTTRAPRRSERDGEDYHFVSPERFRQMQANGELLESATVHQDTLYGTPRGPVDTALASGRSIILEIDFQGARSVRQQLGDATVLVFVAPPSWEALVSRLRGRNTESPEAVLKRIQSARAELADIGSFDYLLVNNTISEAAAELLVILGAERLRRSRCHWTAFRQQLLAQVDADL